MSDLISSVGDQDFELAVIQAEHPVLVDFWAEWCGPCRMMAPVLEQVAEQWGPRLKIVKMDIDANPVTPTKYGIRQIPTLLLFKDGQVLGTTIGLRTQSELKTWLAEHLEF